MKFSKINHSIFTWILTAMLTITLISCSDSTKDKKTIKEVKQDTKDFIEALEIYTVDQRNEVVKITKTAFNELNERIDAMETKIDNNWDQMDKATRKKARISLKALRKQSIEVAMWYGRLETSSDKRWKKIQKGFLDAYKNLSYLREKSEKEFSTYK